MIEDLCTTQANGSRDEKRHCGNNGNYPVLALYQRFTISNPQTPEERKGQIRLSLLEISCREKTNGQKKFPEVTEQPLIPPLFPNQDLEGYEKVDSKVRMCGVCNEKCDSYCRNLLIIVEEAKLHGNNCDLVTFQCTRRLYPELINPSGDTLTTTYYREKR